MCKMFDAFEFENVSLYCKETLQYIPKFQITVKCKTQYDIVSQGALQLHIADVTDPCLYE